MTGSGKTGLGMDLVEEALLAGIPVLVLDPKGDMGNLALVFPDLSAGELPPLGRRVRSAGRGRERGRLRSENRDDLARGPRRTGHRPRAAAAAEGRRRRDHLHAGLGGRACRSTSSARSPRRRSRGRPRPRRSATRSKAR